MSESSTGVKSILRSPVMYNFVQNVLGAKRTRKMLVREYLKPFAGCRILDIGCGTADILELLPESVEYHGFDCDQSYIEFARNKFGSRGKFSCEAVDRMQVKELSKVDIVLALGLLHHLDDHQAIDFLEVAASALSRDGKMITVDPCLTNDQNPLARWLIQQDRGNNVRNHAGYTALAEKVFSRVNPSVSHRSFIPYTFEIMVCRN